MSDASGEAFYLRDEESGHFWSPMPLPARGATPYVSRHGFGYSVFEHVEDGIHSEVWVYVALDAAAIHAGARIAYRVTKTAGGGVRVKGRNGNQECVLELHSTRRFSNRP